MIKEESCLVINIVLTCHGKKQIIQHEPILISYWLIVITLHKVNKTKLTTILWEDDISNELSKDSIKIKLIFCNEQDPIFRVETSYWRWIFCPFNYFALQLYKMAEIRRRLFQHVHFWLVKILMLICRSDKNLGYHKSNL